MRTRILGMIGLAVVASSLAVAAMVNRPAQSTLAATAGQTEPNSISVLGEGVVLARATQATSIFGVEVVDKSLAQAQREAATRMEAVLNKLVELGVDKNDIKTARFNVQPEYDHESPQSVLTGYRVSNAISVGLKDLDAVGSIIDAVVEAGAVRVDGISFEVGDPSPLKSQAREQAMANAKSKAEQLAQLAGVTLGGPIRIEESDAGGVTPVLAAPAARSAMDARTPIVPGEVEIRTQVRVVYAIQ